MLDFLFCLDFDMTIKAILSLKKKSPSVTIGIIIPPNKILSAVVDQITHALGEEVSNIIFKPGKVHFDNWNPTQV
jgi:hypothetical protein